ncbi:unnamed protein product [Ceutorhynchus assimilis]|uniref:phosphoserine transaminase n=1 Tax=Ceutorhynchus assimilis TaxID=467358 RepID=A0A9N9MFQ5_9CUCU|nr:unnamed protein product [Ceutorhynchus assimilis]
MSNNNRNFGAGPGKIPDEVLKEAQLEFLSYQNIGFSVTELSHRSEAYAKINQEAQDDLRELLNVPSNYKILFLHGGGQGLFSAVAMNLIGENGTANYAVAGIWSKIAANEAKKYGRIDLVFPEPDSGTIPAINDWTINPKASYLYYCDNETIQGIEFPFVPDSKEVPLVADMSSNLLTRKFDVSKFGVIIAAVQKNLGTAGLGIVIIKDTLLDKALNICPSILNFKLINEYESILNTPPIFSIYMFGKVLKWIKNQGGLDKMEQLSIQKSQLLYNTLKQSNGFYHNNIPEQNRSRINVPFRINKGDVDMENKFLKEAEERKLFQLKGHKLVGGIRVSMNNAVTCEDVQVLVEFMKEFQQENQ